MDADGGVQTEAAAGLPGEHVLYGVLVEEAAALEEAEYATLQRAFEALHVVARDVRRLGAGRPGEEASGGCGQWFESTRAHFPERAPPTRFAGGALASGCRGD
jgi:hypothetical protein